MPLFLSEDEYERCSHDASLVAEKADAFIRELYNQFETVKAQADAAAITAEQTCSLLEQKYVSLTSEFAKLESQNSQLNSTLEQHLSELAQVQSLKHQIHLKSIEKDGEIERLSTEASELHRSKRQLNELLEQKDLEISEKSAAMKSYLDKIVNLSDSAGLKEARLNEIDSELARSHAACTRLSQEKELIQRHNIWLNDELATKMNSQIELRRAHSELEADMSAKTADLERRLNESLSSLKWNKDRVTELEMKLTSLQEDLSSSKDAAAANEERYSAEISTVTKLVDLYKESSEEWSKKAGELEGVIRALETHFSQVENDYKERLEKEISATKEFQKEAADLKERLEKFEAEVETNRKASELNLLPLSTYTAQAWVDSGKGNDMVDYSHTVVPNIPLGISGTALAASLLRDGWSLAKMYAKYQEAVDALRHEQLGRKHSQAILERVLYEIEEKAGIIMDERVEHERLVEAYSVVNQKLQHSLSEQTNLERNLQEFKADLRRHERDYSVAQKEIVDLQKQVTILLKECRDVQLRCGSMGHNYAGDTISFPIVELNADSDTENVISERLLTFKDINGLVEQNVQLRSLVRSLSDQIGNRDMELKEKFDIELQKNKDEAAAKVNAVLARAEEQGLMIESLHTSVAMYKKLYEEEQKLHSPYSHIAEATSGSRCDGRKDLMLLLEGSQEATKKAQEQASERVKCLEEDLGKLRSEMTSLRSERDKFALEANFAREKLDRFMKEFEHQRDETNGVISRNVEFSQLIIDYQRKLREGSESVLIAEELSRKLTMELSVLKHEKEMMVNSEKRACDEVCNLSERVHRLQASLDTIQSAEEVREEARRAERRKLEEYIRQIEKEWAEAKKELQEQRDNVRRLTVDREETMKNAMRQVEEMGKELANALSAVASAEARAVVAEARCSDMEKKIKSSEPKIAGSDVEFGISFSSTNEAIADLCIAREEIEKLREEAQANKDHMLQYKSIAQVNEAALKQMELAHENFKIEADKVRMSLEAELLSIRERVNELESELSFKFKEAASSAAEKEAALASALSETDRLKQEISVKMSQIATMDIQICCLKEDLGKEHQRWRDARTNYERQVILQSETIQELTKTSEALALLQEEAAELRKLADALKTENNEIKSRWEEQKSMLEESKNEAEKKYIEINEQNKILHSRVEALHIKLAEKDCHSAGISSGSTSLDPLHDAGAGLQNVVNYLRRSKEIAETEISLLKQEKLRLQSQLESSLKAAEAAQASLHAERVNPRARLFTEEEFKSLQLQVREVNLLRESNIQLREENKHNFEECQKLREVAQRERMEVEQLETLLRERETEVEACRKEIEKQKMEKEHLEKRVYELLERCKNIDVKDKDYVRTREDAKQMQTKILEKDAQLEELNKLLSDRQLVISELERDLVKSKMELNEKEGRVNESFQVEVSLKSDVEKQKKLVAQLKKKLENLSKEKEELSKENQALSKQLEDYRQGAWRGVGDAAGEHALKEKEKEKDTRIQILEKTVERQREELKTERAKRLKTEKAIYDTGKSVSQEKTKLVDELEKHKQSLRRLSDEVEKLKHAKSSLPEGTSAVQSLSGTDDLSAAYFLAIENFEHAARLVSTELGTPVADISPFVEASSSEVTSDQAVPSQGPSILSAVVCTSSLPSVKPTEDRERRSTLPKLNVDSRKLRRLIRPRIGKPEEPLGDREMPEVEGSNNDGKPASSHNLETQGSLMLVTNATVRKRLASSTSSELQGETLVQHSTTSDVAAPALKKSKASDFPQEGAEGQTAAAFENVETCPVVEEPSDAIGDIPQGSNEEMIDAAEKDNVETVGEQDEEPKIGGTNQIELQNESNDFLEDIGYRQNESEGIFDDETKEVAAEQDISGSEREEGELVPDFADVESGGNMSGLMESQEIGENQTEPTVSSPPVVADEEGLVSATMDSGDTSSPYVLVDEADMMPIKKNEADMMGANAEEGAADDSNEGNSSVAMEADQNLEAVTLLDPTSERRSTGTGAEGGVSKQSSPPSVTAETQEANQLSPVGKISTTINLQERAKQKSALRQAGVVPSSLVRGRGRAARGRGGRGGGRGQSSG
ncbi:nuclear-pore anchor isoform X3 [Rhododendron vialii]|uniref:nuclear-pore anchor isoform X3 n=1 Tax=Rhododendron vialii TaxID=182163 RepID=UPI00265F0035|nr:nuclear-pore anchor isoform X3 [Rhododendron vialii]